MAKVQVSFRVEEAVVRRVRNVVAHHRGAPYFLTLDGVVEEQLEKFAAKMERNNNEGEEYGQPRRKATGR